MGNELFLPYLYLSHVAVVLLALLLPVLEVSGSKLGPETSRPEFRDFPQYLQESALKYSTTTSLHIVHNHPAFRRYISAVFEIASLNTIG
jgi:hypothetical protein